MKELPQTLGALKASGYKLKTIKQELRENLIHALKAGKNVFPGIIGYTHSVIPDVEKAILAGHNINFLGLRGQAKTRLARLMVNLLDEYVPAIKDSPLNEDPLAPVTDATRLLIEEQGDELPIRWIHRDERYSEKLATPDVSVADLIGDIDPIKAATLKLSFSDERVIHYGLVPRSNRCIFVINELPDLQARIQVALFNILQEGDVQIRGFKIRLPLDMHFVFTANPEDYTNRGSIITPLKDRIGTQILTHYPLTIEDARTITQQESRHRPGQEKVHVPEQLKDLVEQISFEARKSEYIDAKSGVSARLSISAYEMLLGAVERRMLINSEEEARARWTDMFSVVPAINGKVELVYEGEQEGQHNVAVMLIGKAIRTLFPAYFPDPERIKRKKEKNPYEPVVRWFQEGHEVEFHASMSEADWENELMKIKGLAETIEQMHPRLARQDKLFMMEFLLYGLAEYSLLSRHVLEDSTTFRDLFNSMFSMDDEEDLEA